MLRWTVHKKGGPRRSTHAAVAVGHKVYSFGGFCVSFVETHVGQMDVYVFNTVSLRWEKLLPVTTPTGECSLEVPSVRWYHTAALIDNTVYIWGGGNCDVDDKAFSVLYVFDVDTHRWSKPSVSGTVPEPRFGHSACVLGRVMYIFGGRSTQTGSRSSDIYKLDTTTMAWSLIHARGTLAPASSCHSATMIERKMFVFGGRSDDQEREDKGHYHNINVFDTETNCWLEIPDAQHPEGREDHSAFAYNGELYIVGGDNDRMDQSVIDIWKLNPETFSWKKVEPMGKELGPCRMCRMCGICCMVGDRIILDLDTPHDLYVLDLNPSLLTLCKVATIKYGLEQSGLPHDIKWELHRESN